MKNFFYIKIKFTKSSRNFMDLKKDLSQNMNYILFILEKLKTIEFNQQKN